MDLTERFVNGLKKNYDLTLEDIESEGWKYCGGDRNTSQYAHLDKFFKWGKRNHTPRHVDKCVCGHEIKVNCYITNDKELIIIGSCCIKRFIPGGLKKLCLHCKEPHRNRSTELCNDCKDTLGICRDCGRSCDGYVRCYNCNKKNSNSH
jgi:hypothetical protein